MTVYKGNVQQGNLSKGSNTFIKGYKGNQLIYQSSLPSGTKLFESSTPGNYSINLTESRKYRIVCQAAGGGGATIGYTSFFTDMSAAGGGGGSGFDCIIYLDSGNYAISIGSGGTSYINTRTAGSGGTGGNSSFGSAICYGGEGGKANSGSVSGTGGAGGAAPYIPYSIETARVNAAGQAGDGTVTGFVYGGMAAVSDNPVGAGKGGSATSTTNTYAAQAGANGYVSVLTA